MPDASKITIVVISVPANLGDGQADAIRKRALDMLGPDVKVLVVGSGASVYTVSLDDVKADQ